jgi:hypothetical protein
MAQSSETSTKDRDLASALARQLSLWHHAVQAQRCRILEAPPRETIPRNVDALLFTIALHDVARAVKAIGDRFGGRHSGDALAVFELRVPRFKDIRDVVEHFDAYEAGEGKLQSAKAGAGRIGELLWMLTWSGGVCLINVADGLQLEVASAAMVADDLIPPAMVDIDQVLNPWRRD